MTHAAKYLQSEAVTDVEFIEVDSVSTIVQKVTDHPMADMSTVFDSTFQELGPLLTTQGITPIGPAFSLHHRMPTDTATFEVGLPVDKPLERAVTTESGMTLEPSELPGGSIARISHLGAYDGLGEAWEKFMESVGNAGKQPDLPFWEVYVTEPTPEADPATMRTDLVTKVAN